MSTGLSAALHISFSACMFISASVGLSIYQFVCLFVCYLSVYLCMYLVWSIRIDIVCFSPKR